MAKQSSENEKYNGILNLFKKVGETPLERLDRLRLEQPEYAGSTLSYLGRLDPLAAGVLLVAVGEENKNRHSYLSQDKEYEVQILCGVETDTHDVLGLLTEQSKSYNLPDEEVIKKTLKSFVGKTQVPYPLFSSKPYKGKPLFVLAKDGLRMSEDIPQTVLDIDAVEVKQISQIESTILKEKIFKMVDLVKGDFRQDQIKEKWNTFFAITSQKQFTCITISVSCKSGSYMRTLAHEFGKKIGISALAFSIVRTKVGEHLLKDSI